VNGHSAGQGVKILKKLIVYSNSGY